MSKTLDKLATRYPGVVQSVSDESGSGDGYWLYLEPGWYCGRTDCGTIHEYTIHACLEAFKERAWDPDRWLEEYPGYGSTLVQGTKQSDLVYAPFDPATGGRAINIDDLCPDPGI